jgi:cytochrome c peroxidase
MYRPRVQRLRGKIEARMLLVWVGLASAGGCRQKETPRATAAPSTSAMPASISSARPPAPGGSSFYATNFSRRPSTAAMTELGRRLFFDPKLSASRKMSCATCHDPRFAYGPPDARSTQPGGPDMRSPGVRAVPSLRYLQNLPPFSEHHFDEAVDESVDQGPTGGHTWDGRADTTHDQARLPLTSPSEMANEDMEAVARRVGQSAYAAQFREAFGDDLFNESSRASVAILLCLEVFQQSPKDFYPFSSRYDDWLRHKVELTPREQRGQALFGDPNKGNCASCHPHEIREGAFPHFTDFGFAALGVPRNRATPANRDPAFYDMGLCGPMRTDLSSKKEYCGQFKAPTLRNVATRRVFFHNGVFHDLRQVIEFYAQRDTRPGRWYTSGGHLVPFDDLPPEYRANVNREPPFGRDAGAPSALTSAEVDDLIAFLKTLSDADVASQ